MIKRHEFNTFNSDSNLKFHKIKGISKSYKTKDEGKSYKYEQPKPNKYTKKGSHKNCSKINK